MKKILIAFIALATLWSCHTDQEYENLNIDGKNPVEVPANFLFNGASVRLARQMASPNVNLNIFRFISQYLTATTYLDEPNYDLNVRNIPANHWSVLYRNVLYDLKDAKRFVNEDETLSQANKDARLAQIEVIQVYTWQVLVDTFGDIPYSEALNPNENTLPAYDDAATIYADLLSRIEAAAPALQEGNGFATDPIYGGDMNKWYKFANSVHLKLAMRLADSNPQLSQTNAETAVSRGVFESNEDNADVAFDEAPPYTNPLWNDLVQSGRSDYVVANTIVDYLNDLEDPRRPELFQDNIEGGYVGGEYGSNNDFGSHTHIGTRFLDPTLPGILQDYVEVRFLQAEAAERGYNIPGSAEEHYNAAVTASILFYGGTEEQAAAYLAQPEVAYDSAQWREKIGLQFWIAMFDNPFEGWAVWRKYDAPELNIAGQSQRPVPLRYTYPIPETNLNETNYNAAASAIGGDDQQTPIFWDVN